MALAQAAKIQILGVKQQQPACLEVLQNLGVVQIEPHPENNLEKIDVSQTLSEVEYALASTKFCLEFLSRFDTAKKSLASKLNPKIELSAAEIEARAKKTDIKQIATQTQEIEQAINTAQNEISKAQVDAELLRPWQELGFIPNHEQQTGGYDFSLISVNPEQFAALTDRLTEKMPLSVIEKVHSHDNKIVSACIIFKKSDQPRLHEIFNELSVTPTELPDLQVSVAEKLRLLLQQIERAEREIINQQGLAQRLSATLPELKIAFDYFSPTRESLVQQQKLRATRQTFSLVGWADEDQLPAIEKELNKVTDMLVVSRLDIQADDVVPSIFKNSWAEPFEMVTALYGAPQRTEPDPTPFLAPFFTLFFGMAMTDAGYGLLLAGLTMAAIKIFKIPRQSQKLLRVLFWGGIATFVLGALTGGWFSIQLETLPAAIGGPLLAIQLVNPVENPLIIFYIALALGVIQVLTGLIINLVWKLRHGQALDGLLGSGAWVLMLVSLLLFGGGSMELLPSAIGQAGKWLALLATAAIVYNGMRSTKNIFLKPGLGILRLYGIVGYFSDVLSYSRLLALGLTTGIIGMVVNLIAGLVLGIPWVGWLAALIVLVGGHLFNLIINALGAFIHSGRLQFIEFFPKFMEGGGQAFQPFTRTLRYVRVTK